MAARLLAVVLLTLSAVVLTVPWAGPSAADEDQPGRIARMAVSAELHAHGGAADVVVDLDLDLGNARAHGPYLTLAELQEITGDPDHYRRLEVTDITAYSPTAPDDLAIVRDGGALVLYIGDEDVEITGRHTYRVGYTVRGLLDTDGGDELFWNVIAPGGFAIDVDDVSVVVTGPPGAEEVDCFVGPTGSTDRCDETVPAEQRGVHRFAHDRLDPGEGLSVRLLWPAGTFTGAEPVLVPRRTLTNSLQLTPLTGGVAGVATVLGIAAVAAVASRRGKDATAPTGAARGAAPGPLRTTPPDGVRPGELGTLADEVAHPRDVAATLVDLSVRGYVRIEETTPQARQKHAWRLVRLRDDTAALEGYERVLLDGVFGGRGSVSLEDLSTTYAGTRSRTQRELYRAVTDRGWFTGEPRRVRTRWALWGLGVLTVGLLAGGLLLLVRAPAILALPVILIGVALMVAAPAAPARTASGSAVLGEVLAFRDYLGSAGPDDLRTGGDQFSRYLPYAIALGLEERWARAYADLAGRGVDVPQPSWYVAGAGVAVWSRPEAFTDGLTAFVAASSSAVATAGGGDGGGGGAGGGGGGMGGGSW